MLYGLIKLLCCCSPSIVYSVLGAFSLKHSLKSREVLICLFVGPSNTIAGKRRNVNLLTFMLRSLKAERCDLGGGGGGGNRTALEPFQNKVSSLVFLL